MTIKVATTDQPKPKRKYTKEERISTAEFFRHRHYVKEIENDLQRVMLVRNTAKAMSKTELTETNREDMLWQFLQIYINIHK